MRGEKRKKNKFLSVLILIILLLIILIIAYVLIGIYKENRISLKNGPKSNLEATRTILEDGNNVEKVDIDSEYLGYEVSAKLQIPNINLETYVFKKYSKETLNLGPTKFWGPDANEVGNFCIVGHNYKKENMFYNLIDLKLGDEIYLLDNKNGKYTYTIYDIYKVKPNDTTPIEQNTNGKREITLITCVNYSNTRLIIKAIEN